MLTQLLISLGQFSIQVILFLGYPGILILMAMESMMVPLPSELVMPFAGFLASQGKLNLALIIVYSSLGSLLGSLLSYYIGKYGGYKLVLKYGKYLFLDAHDLEKTEQWFARRGSKTIFLSRFIPVVRHLISIPAGIGKMDLKKFCIYTIAGATLWNTILAYFGYILGKNWEMVRKYMEFLSLPITIIVLVLGIFMIYRHVRHKKSTGKF